MTTETVNRRNFLRMLGATGICTAAIPGMAWGAEVNKPNIVVVLADDLGLGEVTCYEPNIGLPTPNIDRLARDGMRFTDAHAASSVCSPSRYNLLTGRYGWRTRLQGFVWGTNQEPLIKADELTVGEYLRQNGYTTALVGKWHIGFPWPRTGGKTDFSKPIQDGPLSRGFDFYFGQDVVFGPPYTYIRQDRYVDLPTAQFDKDTSEQAKLFTGGPITSGPMAPDWDFTKVMPDLTREAVRYIAERGADKKPFFLLFSQTSPHQPIAPSKAFQGKSGKGDYADFILETDGAVGDVLDALDRAGLSENTLVIFTADNGTAAPGKKNVGSLSGPFSGPYVGGKGAMTEGGHRVPFLARWPKQIPAGSTNNHVICLGDLMATAADIVGVPLPKDAAPDSISFLNVLRNPTGSPPRVTLVNHSRYGQFALRQGPWKLVFGKTPGDVRLFRPDEDPTEKKDLAATQPERVSEMTAMMEKLIADGRSTPGSALTNDVKVELWKTTNR